MFFSQASAPPHDELRPRFGLCAALLLLAVTNAIGCASFGTRPAANGPLTYSLVAPNGATGWLFGSVHVGRPGQEGLPPRAVQALADAELLILEIDLSQTSETEVAAAMRRVGTLENGLRLRDVVSRDTWTAVVEHAQRTGGDIAALERLEPWVVAFHFTSLMYQALGFDADHGVEQKVVASTAAKPVRGLETPEEQFAAFDSLPLALQERMLVEAITPASAEQADALALFEAWRRGDSAQLESIFFAERDDPEMAPFYESAYFGRNRRMASGIESIMSEHSRVFAIVGVGHLVGEQGIPALLERSGFRVERVSSR